MLRESAGFKRRVFPHGIRHTCATAMLQGCADIRYIGELLGYESLSSTAIYTSVTIDEGRALALAAVDESTARD